jgi:hypothetical protein
MATTTPSACDRTYKSDLVPNRTPPDSILILGTAPTLHQIAVAFDLA